MSLNPRVCKKSYKVHIPMMGEACEFWLITVTDEQSITNPDKDHAYLTDDGKLFVFNGDSLVRVNCDICFTQEEREKLEGIEEGANKYVLPVASSTELGGVLLGYTQNGRNYPITKDTKGNIYVNVPWEEYQLPKATNNALGGIKTGYKQNGKFYPIKTDTDGNAYVQVPWEDTNTVYEVVSKTSNGLMPMLPSDENASKRFLNGDGEWVVGTDNSINGVTQTGSTFSGETSDCGVQILEVQGKTSQKTTNGYQLFDASKLPTKSQGGATVTNNNDGSITISGSGNLTENFSQAYWYSKEDTLSLLKQGTLKVNGLGNISPNIIFGLRNKTTGGFVSGKYVSKNTSSCQITQNDLDTLGDDIVLSFATYTVQGTQIVSGTIKPMIYQDGDGTWEQYTGGKPAPNPDYPMDIENVEISKIDSTNVNLYPVTDKSGDEYGMNFIFKDGVIYLTGTATEASVIRTPLKKRIPKGTKLTFTCENEVLQRAFQVRLNKNDENYPSDANSRCYFDTKNAKLTFTTSQDNDLVDIYIEPNVEVDVTLKIVLSYGDGNDVTEFVPYKGATVETSLTLAKDDVYSKGTILRKRKKVVLDGSSDEGWTKSTSYENSFVIKINDLDINSNTVYCNRFKFTDKRNIFGTFFINSSGKYTFVIEGINELEEWKTWLSTHNTVVEYELATPTTEEFKVPTIPSYYPYTEVSTDSKVEPEITFKPLPYTTCLVGEATEEESGYMPALSGDASQFLNGQGGWSTPSGYTLPTASTSQLGGVKIGSNISISDGAISIDKDNVTKALGYTPPTKNTTYEKVDKSSDGLCPKLPNETTTTKYLRQDGAWAVPPNTTYEVASTSSNGLMSSSDKTKLTNLRRIWKGTSSSPPSGWVDGDIYVQYEE